MVAELAFARTAAPGCAVAAARLARSRRGAWLTHIRAQCQTSAHRTRESWVVLSEKIRERARAVVTAPLYGEGPELRGSRFSHLGFGAARSPSHPFSRS